MERLVGGRKPHSCLVAYRLFVIDGLHAAQVAELLGICQATVYQRVRRVREAMHDIGISEPEAVEVIQSME
jgi:predicted transcriptional regulator